METTPSVLYIGTAGWTIPKTVREAFPAGDSALSRYAERFSCTEINSSFYRPHRRSTYERWAATVPDAFRFSLKVPKAITHERKLTECSDLLEAFIGDTSALGEKLGAYLVQLAPSHAYDTAAAAFFDRMRKLTQIAIACEPRHPSWWKKDAQRTLRKQRITIAGADPARFEDARLSIPYGGFAYYRWHGSPRTYYSSYDQSALQTFARTAAQHGCEAWCIFDNTASGAAAANALAFAQIAD